jgi:FKBP-type peptidyl-prolyl cis-trans isomerase FklB
MNNALKLTLGAALLAAIAIAQSAPPQHATVPATSASKGAAAQSQAPVVFQSAKDKLSYAVGVEWAAGLKWRHTDVDPELVVRGFRDALANDDTKLQMTPKDLAATLKTYEADRKRGLAHAAQILSVKNAQAGAEFVSKNARKNDVVTLPSGLQYRILKQGSGRKPTLEDIVECHYRGTFVDGTEFDSSYARKAPQTFPVKGAIKGWREALQLMPVGSKWQLVVPPQLAYGEHGAADTIGPNATIIFDVELISVKEKPTSAGGPTVRTRTVVAGQGIRQ